MAKKKDLTPRQNKLVKALTKGGTLASAAIKAGYTSKHARQAGFQALEQIKMRMPEILDQHGLTDNVLIDKYLLPLMNANSTRFFAFRKEVERKKKGQKEPVIETVQVIEKRDVIDWNAREAGLEMAFRLKGSYAAENDPKGSAGPTVIVIDIPRPDRQAAIDVKKA